MPRQLFYFKINKHSNPQQVEILIWQRSQRDTKRHCFQIFIQRRCPCQAFEMVMKHSRLSINEEMIFIYFIDLEVQSSRSSSLICPLVRIPRQASYKSQQLHLQPRSENERKGRLALSWEPPTGQARMTSRFQWPKDLPLGLTERFCQLCYCQEPRLQSHGHLENTQIIF